MVFFLVPFDFCTAGKYSISIIQAKTQYNTARVYNIPVHPCMLAAAARQQHIPPRCIRKKPSSLLQSELARCFPYCVSSPLEQPPSGSLGQLD